MNQNLTDIFLEGLMKMSAVIPSKVMEQANKCLLDYMGVVVGGSKYLQKQHPEFFKALVKDSGECSVFGTDYKTTASNAAWLNGFSAHVLELDDGHRFGMIHLGASIISAVLAVAEQEKLEQNDILQGIVMGYESAIRCACAVQPSHKVRGYHVSGTCGTMGSAIGIGFACKYSLQQLKSTLSSAVTSAAGVLEIQEDASELKPYNLGRAAMDGVAATTMGALSLSGPDDIMGGKRGFLGVMTETPNPDYLTDFTSSEFGIEKIYQKVYAACRHCHPAIEAAIAIRNDINIEPEQVEKIEVHTYKLAVGGHDHKVIKGMSSAKLSTPFSVAMAIVKGNAGFVDYSEESLNDALVLSLTRKVDVLEDERLTSLSPAKRAARVTIYTENGVFEHQVDYPKGQPENPISTAEIQHKTLSLLQGYRHPFLKKLI